MVHVSKEVVPDATKRGVYDFYYDKYLRTYCQLREVMHEVAAAPL